MLESSKILLWYILETLHGSPFWWLMRDRDQIYPSTYSIDFRVITKRDALIISLYDVLKKSDGIESWLRMVEWNNWNIFWTDCSFIWVVWNYICLALRFSQFIIIYYLLYKTTYKTNSFWYFNSIIYHICQLRYSDR